MIIVAYLTDDFVKDTLAIKFNTLRYFLEKFFDIHENIILLGQPNTSLKKIFLTPPAGSKPDNLKQWKTYIGTLKKQGRLIFKDDLILKKQNGQDLKKNINSKEQFLNKALSGKIFKLSLRKNSDISLDNFPSLGKDLDDMKINLDRIIKENQSHIFNLNKKQRKDLFLNKLGGYCCFFNTLLWIDPYIIQHRKGMKNRHLRNVINFLKGSKIEKLIVITKDPYASLQDPDDVERFKPKKENIYQFFETCNWINKKNKTLKDIEIFFALPNVFKQIHSRYALWTNLDKNEKISSLNLIKSIKMAIFMDRGDGYFEDDLEDFQALFNYVSNFDSNKIITTFLKFNENIKDNQTIKARDYWENEHSIKERNWFHINEIFDRDPNDILIQNKISSLKK